MQHNEFSQILNTLTTPHRSGNRTPTSGRESPLCPLPVTNPQGNHHPDFYHHGVVVCFWTLYKWSHVMYIICVWLFLLVRFTHVVSRGSHAFLLAAVRIPFMNAPHCIYTLHGWWTLLPWLMVLLPVWEYYKWSFSKHFGTCFLIHICVQFWWGWNFWVVV